MDIYKIDLNFISEIQPSQPQDNILNSYNSGSSLLTGDFLFWICIGLFSLILLSYIYIRFRKTRTLSVFILSCVIFLSLGFTTKSFAYQDIEHDTNLSFTPININMDNIDFTQSIHASMIVDNNSIDIASLEEACLYCEDQTINNFKLVLKKGNQQATIPISRDMEKYNYFEDAYTLMEKQSSVLDIEILTDIESAKKLVNTKQMSLYFKAAKAVPKVIWTNENEDKNKQNLIFVCDAREYNQENVIKSYIIDNEDEGDLPSRPQWTNEARKRINNSVIIKPNFNSFKPLNVNFWFAGIEYLAKLPEGLEYINTSKTLNMQFLFNAYGQFTNINEAPDLSSWDISNVRSLSFCFDNYGGESVELEMPPNVSTWNTSKCENFYRIFSCYGYKSDKLKFPVDVSSWDTYNVKNFSQAFASYGYSSKILALPPDVSKWKVDNAVSFETMFDCYAKESEIITMAPDTKDWNTEHVENIAKMFISYGASSPLLENPPDVSKWDVSNVSHAEGMFNSYGYSSKCLHECPNVYNWNTKSFEFINDVFFQYGCSSEILYNAPNLSNWNLPKVNTIHKLFGNYGYLEPNDAPYTHPGYIINMPKIENIQNLEESSRLFACSKPNYHSCIVKIIWNADFTNKEKESFSKLFENCILLVGENGTKWNKDMIDNQYACLDTEKHKGYFSL